MPRDRIVIIGGGIAGLATALHLSPAPVTLLIAGRLGSEAATSWAQGGIAAAIGEGDVPQLHAADTLAAGAGLSDPEVADRVTAAAPACIEHLLSLGTPFDRGEFGALAFGLEAAHSRRRILHAGGDQTGRLVLETLIRVARARSTIEICEHTRALDLVTQDGVVNGVLAAHEGRAQYLHARAVVLATGGVGGLYRRTTNPLGAIGTGVAMVARAGASLRDLEFVQFHPTAIDIGADPMPLATEAIRGEGAILINDLGERFMADLPGAELAPRDVVARAIWRQIELGRSVLLDGRNSIGNRFPRLFPAVTALCHRAGLDPVHQPIPVRPAAHYHMGGVEVDRCGRTSLGGLWACGEVAATGLHGANRLASNSLLEALAYARWIAADIGSTSVRKQRGPTPLPAVRSALNEIKLTRIRDVMDRQVGVIRSAHGLAEAVEALIPFAARSSAALTGLMIAVAALQRRESRGGHMRCDHPETDPKHAQSNTFTLAEIRSLAQSYQPPRVAAQ